MKDPRIHSQDEAPWIPGLADLEMTRLPRQDLWPAIEGQLPARAAGRWRWFGALAATVLAAVAGLSVWLMPTPMGSRSSSPAASPRLAMAQEFGDLALAGPENRSLVQANLQIVQDAESRLQQALNRDPDNIYLRQLLDSTRRQQGDLRSLLAQSVQRG